MSDVYIICKELTSRKTKSHNRIVGKALTIEEINENANAKRIAEMKDKLVNEYHIQQRKLFETYHQKLKDEYDKLQKEFTDKLHTIDPLCNTNDILGL
jgi:thymidylate kinase